MYDYHRFHLSGAKFRGKNTAKHENYVIIYLHIQLISSSLHVQYLIRKKSSILGTRQRFKPFITSVIKTTILQLITAYITGYLCCGSK